MSVRLLDREEIGIIASFIDYEIVREVLKKVYDYKPASEYDEILDNRKRFAKWLFRANAIAVSVRYNVVLPTIDEIVMYSTANKKRHADAYKNALTAFVYQIDEQNDIYSTLMKNAVMRELEKYATL